jgi:hypothetical protein
MEQQRLLCVDQALIEGEARQRCDLGRECRKAINPLGDSVEVDKLWPFEGQLLTLLL